MRKFLLISGLFFIFANCCWAVTSREQTERLLVLNALLFDLKMNGIHPESGQSLGVDLIHQPEIDDQVGRKDEGIDRPLFVPRPRYKIWIDDNLLGAALIPPVEVKGMSAFVGSVEYALRLNFGKDKSTPAVLRALKFYLRTTLTVGRIEGPIASADQPDQVDLSLATYEAALSYRHSNQLIAFAGMGTGRLDSSIKIAEDGAQIEVNNERFEYVFAGATWRRAGYLYSFQQNIHDLLRNFSFAVEIAL
ncbi:MAG: hypothetical protein O7A69_01320 [SAR324 cluster bacterium]|nr:hypothetical protein [SAR324 cluster bacterium]